MIFTDLFENRQQHPTRTVRVVEQDEAKGTPFQKTMVRPDEAYQRLAGRDPKAFAIDVLMPDQSAVKRLQAAIGNQAKIRGDDSIAGDGMGIQIVTPVFPDGRAAQQAFEMMMDLIRTHGGGFNQSTGAIIATPTSQDMAEGHADQQRKIVKRNGQPVGEIGIDRESSPGGGQHYMKHYASGLDLSGYDSREEALDDLRHIMKQSVYGELKKDVAEGSLNEGMFDTVQTMIDRFYQENDIDPSQQKLEIRNPGTRVWTRFDGARHRDPGRILSKDPQLMTGFWEWFKTQPGVRPMGSVRGAYMSSDYDEAVSYKGAYFAMTKDGYMVYGSMKRVSNPKSVWLQKSDEGVSEAMKPSDIPPSRRDRLTMRDIEAERPQGAYRFRVTFPDGATADFMDQAAAEQRARAMGGRVEPIDPQPQGLPARNRFRVQDPQGSRPAATFQDRAAAERYASAKKLPVEIIPEERNKPGARIERILKMLRARHPQAENDLEALILDFRGQQAQDRTDIARLDAENDMEEADIQRLERMLDLIRRRRGAAASEPAMTAESLRDGEYHVATVTLDDGTKKKVRITTDEGFRDRIQQHFKKQGRTVQDIDVDFSVRSKFDENKPTFTGAPARPQPQPVNPSSPMLPPAPGRPTMVNKPMQEAKKKPQPTNPELWSRAKAAARSKFDVWPSAYASAWAAKYYKSKGGGWRMGKPKKK